MAQPTDTKQEPSVDELEEQFNAPTTEHPLGDEESNAYGDDSFDNNNDEDNDDDDNNNDSPEDRRRKRNTKDEKQKQPEPEGEEENKPNKGKGKSEGTKGKGAAQSGKKAAGEATKDAAKAGARTGARVGGRVAAETAVAGGLAPETLGLSIVAAAAIEATYQAIRHPKKAAKIIIFIVFLIIGFFLLFVYMAIMLLGLTDYDLKQEETQVTLLQLNKTGPTEGKLNQELVYTITVGYPKTSQDITVIDQLPQGADYVRSSNKVTYNATNRTVTWKARDNITPAIAATAPLPVLNTTFTITLRATQNNITLFNIARATVIPAAATGDFDGINIPPSANDCGMAEYRRYMNMTPDKMNYGDPTCTYIKTDPNGKKIFDKDTLLAMLQKQDATRAKQWYCLAEPESGYNPNAYLGNSTSGRGAYGLYQMNPGGRTGNPGQYDNGKVVWQLQISNAINYNNYLITKGNIWDYWDPRSRAKCNI